MGTTIEKHNWFYQSMQTNSADVTRADIFHFDNNQNVDNVFIRQPPSMILIIEYMVISNRIQTAFARASQGANHVYFGTFGIDKAIKECYFTIPVSYNKWYYHL